MKKENETFSKEEQKSQSESSAKKEIKIRRRKKGTIDKKIGKISAYRKYAEKGYEYRFINPEMGRLENFTEQDDWEKVVDPESKKVLQQVVGKKKDGSPEVHVLVRKRKEWFDEDKNEKAKLQAEAEKEVLRGTAKSIYSDTVEADKMYIPVQDGKAENRTEVRFMKRTDISE